MSAHDEALESAGKCETKEERVVFCARLMARGIWAGYVTRERLAQEWGISDHTLRGYAAEAHRMVAFDQEERDQLRRTAAARLHDIAERARTTFNVMTGMPDFRAEIEALDRVLKYAGVDVDAPVGGTRSAPVVRVVYENKPDDKKGE